MKTILHFSCEALVLKVPNFIIGTAHLITYSIPCMDGEYREMVKVYRNRAGNHDNLITLEQLRILQDCVLNDKPQPEFMKSNAQKGNDIARDIMFNRIRKLEDDIFPNESLCILVEGNIANIRLSRIEKKLGVVMSPGDDLGRLETCEFNLKNVYWRLNRLDKEIYPTQKDVDGMKPVITLDSWMLRLEEKLGVTLAFTDMNHRLRHIEDAWECTKMIYNGKWNPNTKEPSYVCPVLKHQQELQDALQKQFGEKKTYEPKHQIGEIYTTKEEVSLSYEIVGFEKTHQNLPGYKLKCPNGGIGVADAFNADTRDYIWSKKKTYVPKYHLGDVLEYSYSWGNVTHKIIGVGLLLKTQPNIPYYNFDREDGQYVPCEQIDNDIYFSKVTPPVAWEG